jgi:hypothetical protein
MRTTVTLDSDTEAIVRDRMQTKGVTFKRALNDAIRESVPGGPARRPYRTMSRDLGEPLMDLTHANRVAADLEDEALLERMRADG